MNEKMTGRYRPAGKQRYLVEHRFVGTKPVSEAMKPLILEELRRIQTAAEHSLSSRESDSVAQRQDAV